MSLIYILISLITITIFILLKKTNKKENILLWISLSTILMMCFNIFITLMFSILKIKSTLTNLSVAQIILIIFMSINILKKRQIQKYYIKKQDIIISIILIILVSTIAILQYGYPFNIKYMVTDGSVHYLATMKFYNESDLLSNAKFDGITNFNTFMTGAYVNCGIFLKSLSSIITIKDYYTVFAIFDLLILLLSAQLFYLLISPKLHKKTEYILAYIFTILYLLGYALNSTLSGFCYLSLGLDIIIAIMIIIKYFIQKNNVIILLSTSLLTLGLFFSYYYFAPVVYLAIFTFLIRKNIDKKDKILKTENILEIVYILIIPAILGTYYMFFKEIFTQKYNLPNKVLMLEGDIYSNLITNFIVFIPLILIYIFSVSKNRKNDFKLKIFVFEIIFIILLGVGKIFNKVSSYYFYKAYYLLWILTLSISFYSIIKLKRNKKVNEIIIYIILSVYILGIVVMPGILKKPGIIYDIYNYNFKHMKSEYIIEQEYLEIVEFYYENLIDEKNDVYVKSMENVGRAKWIYALYENPIYAIVLEEDSIDKWLNEEKEKYFIYYKKDMEEEVDKNNKNYEIIYSNSSGGILMKK